MERASLRAHTTEYSFTLDAEHAWNFWSFSLFLGGGAGALLTRQSFVTRGLAPPRDSSSPVLFASLGISHDLSNRLYLSLDARSEAHLLRLQQDAASEVTPAAAPRATEHVALRRSFLNAMH